MERTRTLSLSATTSFSIHFFSSLFSVLAASSHAFFRLSFLFAVAIECGDRGSGGSNLWNIRFVNKWNDIFSVRSFGALINLHRMGMEKRKLSGFPTAIWTIWTNMNVHFPSSATVDDDAFIADESRRFATDDQISIWFPMAAFEWSCASWFYWC